MADFPCFSMSMEATAATRAATDAASLLGLSSSSRTLFFFSPLPRKSIRVSNLKRRSRFTKLLSKPNSDLDLLSTDEWPDGSIIFHFGHRIETVGEGVETEKSKVFDGAHDYGTTKPVHYNHDKSKELSHDKDLNVKSDTIGSATVLVTSGNSKAAVGPDLDGSPPNDTVNEGNNIISESQSNASAAVPDLGSPLLDEKVNEGKDIINKIQVGTSTVVSSSEGAQLDHTTSEADNAISESQVDTTKAEAGAINEAEFDISTMVSQLDGSRPNATSNEQDSVFNEAEINAPIPVSSLDDLQLDDSKKKEGNMVGAVQFDASNIVSSSDGFQLDDNVTDKSITISEVQFDTSTLGSSSNGSQHDHSADDINGAIGEVQFHTSTNNVSSNGSQLAITTNEENNIIGETQLGTSTGAPNIDGPQLSHPTNEEGVSIRETKFVTSTTVSNADGSQLDGKVNEESIVISSTSQSQSSPVVSKSDVTLDTNSFVEEKSETNTLVEDISSVTLDPAVSSHPTEESKEEIVQMDVTDHHAGATDSEHDPEKLTVEDSKEAEVKDEVHSADSAKTSQTSMEESGYAETDTNREESLTTKLCLSSGAASLSHPSKALAGGEDAYFIADRWLGVADGACQWSMEGVNTGFYAQKLLGNSEQILSTSKSITDPIDLIVRSTARTVTPGLSTVLVAYFNSQVLHVANIGDTGFMVIRNGIILKRSAPVEHEFNFPVQIETGDDPLEIVKSYQTELDEGDAIVFATDGLFDNLYEQEIVSAIQKSLREGLKPQDIAKILATRAHEVGSSASARSPFADAANAAGYVGYVGGKLDDVAVIVSLVERNSSSPHSCDHSLHLV